MLHVNTNAANLILKPDEGPSVRFHRNNGTAPVLLVCEHASSFIPGALSDLGLAPQDRMSHAVWDIGAADVAVAVSDALDAPLIMSGVSRLVYDCNRPPTARDSIPEKSELIEVPGNRDLTEAARTARSEQIYAPFREAISNRLDAFRTHPALITIHSFTPVYFGEYRPVELGILHDDDVRLAQRMIAATSNSGLRVELNQPYGKNDGVTHTLAEHGQSRGLENVMIEIRNDLISEDRGVAAMASVLAGAIQTALPDLVAADGAGT